jgi:hypothetical protein
MSYPNPPDANPDPTVPMPYATINQAKAAGAAGSDLEVATALVWSSYVIDNYTRAVWSPVNLTVRVHVADNWGRLFYWCSSAATGTLDPDGRTWHPDDGIGLGDYDVSVVAGPTCTPSAIQLASARLAAQASPQPFTAQADAEGNPVGRPPASAQSDLTDPGPPQGRQGATNDRTTGDPVVDAWLEPYKTNRVLIS